MPLNIFKIASVEVTSPSSSIDFTSIPQGYTDLKVVVSGRATGSRAEDSILFRFNSDSTTANYSGKWLRGNGASATSGSSGGYAGAYSGEFNGGTSTANTFTSQEVYIPNYTGGTQKSFSIDITQEANQTTAYNQLQAGLWSGTSAINSITLVDHNSNLFATYTTVTLYGIL